MPQVLTLVSEDSLWALEHVIGRSEVFPAKLQSSTRFDLVSYLLGLRSMAQCVEVKADPTKIYLAGRSGDAVQVNWPFCWEQHRLRGPHDPRKSAAD